ncbi:MAG: hypothetical protein ACKN82_20165, partial [Pirellula sp.]
VSGGLVWISEPAKAATYFHVASSSQQFSPKLAELPSESISRELDAAVQVQHMEDTLMEQGVAKFVAPQKQLLQTIREKRATLANR